MMEGWHMLLAVWNGAKPKHLHGGRYQLEKREPGGTVGILGISGAAWSQMTRCVRHGVAGSFPGKAASVCPGGTWTQTSALA